MSSTKVQSGHRCYLSGSGSSIFDMLREKELLYGLTVPHKADFLSADERVTLYCRGALFRGPSKVTGYKVDADFKDGGERGYSYLITAF